MKVGTGMRAMLPQAKEHLKLPEVGPGKEGFSHRGFRRIMALPKP